MFCLFLSGSFRQVLLYMGLEVRKYVFGVCDHVMIELQRLVRVLKLCTKQAEMIYTFKSLHATQSGFLVTRAIWKFCYHIQIYNVKNIASKRITIEFVIKMVLINWLFMLIWIWFGLVWFDSLCPFVWCESLRPINNLSVKQGRVFLGWTSTKLELMCLA